MKCYYYSSIFHLDEKAAAYMVRKYAAKDYKEKTFINIRTTVEEINISDISYGEDVYIIPGLKVITEEKIKAIMRKAGKVVVIKDTSLTINNEAKGGFEKYEGIPSCLVAYCYFTQMQNGEPFEIEMIDSASDYLKKIASVASKIDSDLPNEIKYSYSKGVAFEKGFKAIYGSHTEATDQCWEVIENSPDIINSIIAKGEAIIDEEDKKVKERDEYIATHLNSIGFEAYIDNKLAFVIYNDSIGKSSFNCVPNKEKYEIFVCVHPNDLYTIYSNKPNINCEEFAKLGRGMFASSIAHFSVPSGRLNILFKI